MSNKRTDAEIIDLAIDVLENTGWCKGTLVNDEGAHCALGSLAAGAALAGLDVIMDDAYGDARGDDDFPEQYLRVLGRVADAVPIEFKRELHLDRDIDPPADVIYCYNDDRDWAHDGTGTTKQDVVDLFVRARDAASA